MNKKIWLLVLLGIVLGISIGVLRQRGSRDPLSSLFPEDKLKGAVSGIQVSIIGNLMTKSITGGEVILAQAVAPRPLQPSEVNPTALNVLRGILSQRKADWICVFLAEDTALAGTSNWVVMAEYNRGTITLRGGLPTDLQIDSVKASSFPILRPDSIQSHLVWEVFDSLSLRADRWTLSQSLRGSSSANLDRENFFKLDLNARTLSDIGKKHGMTGDQVRSTVLGVTRYYWLRMGEIKTST